MKRKDLIIKWLKKIDKKHGVRIWGIFLSALQIFKSIKASILIERINSEINEEVNIVDPIILTLNRDKR